jgi:hypothetical protein
MSVLHHRRMLQRNVRQGHKDVPLKSVDASEKTMARILWSLAVRLLQQASLQVIMFKSKLLLLCCSIAVSAAHLADQSSCSFVGRLLPRRGCTGV